jgi:hypothetical protein
VVSSPPATVETGAMGREIESRQDVGVVALSILTKVLASFEIFKKNCPKYTIA